MPRYGSLLEPRRVPWVGALLLAAVGLLTFSFEPKTNARLWCALFDSAHLPLFATLGWATGWSFRQRGPRHLALGGMFVAALAVGTEALQIPGSRDANWGDLFWNGVGGALGLALAATSLARPSRSARLLTAALALLGIALFAIAAKPAIREVSAFARGRIEFPVLGDFESDLDLATWRAVGGARALRTREWRADGDWSLRVDPAAQLYPGAGIEERSYDWSGWDSLVVWTRAAGGGTDATRPPGDSLSIVVRVDDDGPSGEPSDRFNRTLHLPPEPTRTAIPLEEVASAPAGRRLALGRIRRLLIFEAAGPAARPFLIDGVRLVR